MLSSLPSVLKSYGLKSDVRTILDLYKLMGEGLIQNLGDVYSAGKIIVVQDVREYGPYTMAFFDYFLEFIRWGKTLQNYILRRLFLKCVQQAIPRENIGGDQLVHK